MTRERTAVLDRLGVVASAACAVHCVLAPLAIGSLLALPVNWLWDETTETVLLAMSALIGFSSLTWAYFAKHRHRRCLVTFSIGLSLLLVARLVFHGDGFGVAAAAVGAILVAVAHTLNLKLCRSCPSCHDHPTNS